MLSYYVGSKEYHIYPLGWATTILSGVTTLLEMSPHRLEFFIRVVLTTTDGQVGASSTSNVPHLVLASSSSRPPSSDSCHRCQDDT